MTGRIAIIDLGTNTFHLLIVDIGLNGYDVVYRGRDAVKLGLHGINRGTIALEAMERALESILGFKLIIDRLQVHPENVFAYGTSALRNADNQTEVLSKIRQATNIAVNVIPGSEEARFIYLGVRSAIDLGSGKALIVDIGGGSVEFIIGNANEIFWKQSFELGAQRLLEMFQKHDPILPEEIQQLNELLTEALPSLFDALQFHQPSRLIGVSGTFDTLSDIHCIKEKIIKDPLAPETPLTLSSFRETYQEFLTKNRAERMMIPGMIELRVDMIVVACCLIDFLLTRFSFENIKVSSFALKEGVLSEIIDGRKFRPGAKRTS
jgi:exopolyphosphatase/guanosine-5'-triphosphate,3'-diphosphate pyrophosphatase